LKYSELFDHIFSPPSVSVAALHNCFGVHWLAFDEQSAVETVALKKSATITRQIVGAKFFIVGCYPIKDIAQLQYISVAQKIVGSLATHQVKQGENMKACSIDRTTTVWIC
jgi:hypothetical protein